MPPEKMPDSLGGEVSDAARMVAQRTCFKGVPNPHIIAECVVRVLTKGDYRARSGLRGVVNYYRKANRFGSLVKALEKVLKYEKRERLVDTGPGPDYDEPVAPGSAAPQRHQRDPEGDEPHAGEEPGDPGGGEDRDVAD